MTIPSHRNVQKVKPSDNVLIISMVIHMPFCKLKN